MKILIDIGHPAHVHLFKNFIKIMKKKGHKVFVTAKDDESIKVLLKGYNIDYLRKANGFLKKRNLMLKRNMFRVL